MSYCEISQFKLTKNGEKWLPEAKNGRKEFSARSCCEIKSFPHAGDFNDNIPSFVLFLPPPGRRVPRLSFLHLPHSCVILTSELLSVLRSAAAGETDWIECQAAHMLRKNTPVDSGELWQALLVSLREHCSKITIPPGASICSKPVGFQF